MRKILTISIIAVLLCVIGLTNIALAATPQEGNNSQERPQFDHWVEKRDMSKYSNYNPPKEMKAVFDETWEQTHPGGVVFDPLKINLNDMTVLKDTQFLPNNMVMAKRSSDQMSALMQSTANSLAKSNDSQASIEAYSNVLVAQAYYCWYWTQDVWFNNQITIYNAGPNVASGIVIFGSGEDSYGYAAPFYNLAVGAYTTVTVPFKPATYTSVGIKPIIVEVRVDGLTTDHVRLSTDGIERYNNAAGYLVDPDGGDSLETSDLYHFPLGDGYAIIHEAAQAGDNTYTPYNTAYYTNAYVYYKINYTMAFPYDVYTASDLYIANHESSGHYYGVCDEYATLFTSFERSLGVPAKYNLINMINRSGVGVGHGISEIWDGSKWVHADPTWKEFNNTHVYTQSGYSHIHMWRMSDADDSLYSGDPYGDGLLDWWNDFGIRIDLGEPSEYN